MARTRLEEFKILTSGEAPSKESVLQRGGSCEEIVRLELPSQSWDMNIRPVGTRDVNVSIEIAIEQLETCKFSSVEKSLQIRK